MTPARDDGVRTGQGLILMEGQFIGTAIVATMTTRITFNQADGETLDVQSVNSTTLEQTG